jgi:hypothetical protein
VRYLRFDSVTGSGIFDYSVLRGADPPSHKKVAFDRSCRLLIRDDELVLSDSEQARGDGLACILDSSMFVLTALESPSFLLSVRSSARVALRRGSIIKLAKQFYEVRKINLEEPAEDERVLVSKSACKYCLENEYSLSNPLLEPCNCTGSMAKTHLRCLQKYELSKENPDRQCRICNGPTKLTYKVNGQVHEADAIPPYITLLPLASLKAQPVRLCFLGKDSLTVGRSAEANVLLGDDSSISRLHARFSLREGRVYLEDLNSRYGTYIERTSLKIRDNGSHLLQLGNFLMKVSAHNAKTAPLERSESEE